jgi:hypothetical protein
VASEAPDVAEFHGKKGIRRSQRFRYAKVLKKLWAPNGLPPDHMTTSEAVQTLGKELKLLGISVACQDTLKRAIGRR